MKCPTCGFEDTMVMAIIERDTVTERHHGCCNCGCEFVTCAEITGVLKRGEELNPVFINAREVYDKAVDDFENVPTLSKIFEDCDGYVRFTANITNPNNRKMYIYEAKEKTWEDYAHRWGRGKGDLSRGIA